MQKESGEQIAAEKTISYYENYSIFISGNWGKMIR